MRRRQFITVLGGAAVTWPLGGRAQQKAMPLIGFLSTRSAKESESLVRGFRSGLKEAGFVEGQNITVEYRWADSQYERLPVLAAELVALRVAVIATLGGTLSALAAKAATTTIPIVFALGEDPVRVGLVSSLSQPGGNMTGVAQLGATLSAKRLQLLRELVPQASVIAVLINPKNTSAGKTQAKEVQEAARAVGQQIVFLNASTVQEIDAAFAGLVQKGARALLVPSDPLFNGQREHFAALALRHKVPTIYAWGENVEAGGLISYGSANLAATYAQVGSYVGRILKGAKPAELPVVQPTHFDLAVNAKTAKALGIKIPQSILVQADRVIE
jgi:putative ABC transport system substrate-binding protein